MTTNLWIDESFLRFAGFDHWDLTAHGQRLRQQVKQWLGLPVCVGIAPSKTLAKLANHYAKQRAGFDGVCNLSVLPETSMNRLLAETPVSEVWGVGRRLTEHLAGHGIETVLELKRAPVATLRRRFGVVMERTIRELNGIACYGLESNTERKAQIITSRSFGKLVTSRQELEQAVAVYTARAAEKLRAQNSLTGCLQVFLQTNPFIPDEPQYHPAVTVKLATPTSDTALLIGRAIAGLRQIYREGYRYQKAGVMLLDLSATRTRQLELFNGNSDSKAERISELVDALNQRMGRGRLRRAAEGFSQVWAMKRESVSKGFTTNWQELPLASA